MERSTSGQGNSISAQKVLVLLAVLIVPILFYLLSPPTYPKNAPRPAREQYPIIGAWKFFSHRYSWFTRQKLQSKTGAFSFHAGNRLVVGLSGERGRKIFFENKKLVFGPGYGGMLGGLPPMPSANESQDGSIEVPDDIYFNKQVITVLKGPVLATRLSQWINDVCQALDGIAEQENPVVKPFDSIYDLVYKLTMRTVGCNEVADSNELLRETSKYFSMIQDSASPWTIMYSWLPSFGKLVGFYAGFRLYMILKKIMDDRKKSNKDGGDALQNAMDRDDDTAKIVTVIIKSVFAGYINTAVNAANVLCYLGHDKKWYNKVREEIITVAYEYNADKTLPLKEQLKNVPLDAWERGFPNIDYCLKDSIRLTQLAAGFRFNMSNQEIPIEDGEVIPPGAYVTWHTTDTAFDSRIYSNAEQWDPARYLPDRAEDKRAPYAWTGWGAGRHPCLGMRFAKIEVNLAIAFFLAYFEDLELVDGSGHHTLPPGLNKEGHHATKPKEEIWLKCKHRRN